MTQQEMTQQEMTQQEVNRQQSGIASPAVLASIEATLALLRAEIAQLQRRIQQQVERSAELSNQQRLLCSIPGVGRWTAARVLAEIAAVCGAVCGAVDARQVAASAGLCRPLPA
jgi:transposase